MKSNLPINQISKSQRSAFELTVEPDAKVMQAHFGSQTGLETTQGMRPFPCQTKDREQFVVDRLDQLAQARPSTVATLWATCGETFGEEA